MHLLLLMGCPPDSKPHENSTDPSTDPTDSTDLTDSTDPTDSTDTQNCGVTLQRTVPEAGATDVYYRSAVEFHLSSADPTARITSAIAGTTTLDDSETLVFTPDLPLAPSTSYTVTLEWCGGTADLDFTTSETGSPVDASSLVGRSYSLDLAQARFVKPAGLGSVLGTLFTAPLLVEVLEADASSLTMRGATALTGAGTQDFCHATTEFSSADFSENPAFSVGPMDWMAGIPLHGATFAGAFSPDGSQIDGGTLKGTLDSREIVERLPDLGYDLGSFCDLLAGFGDSCIPCEDSTLYCIEVEALDLRGDARAGTLEEVTAESCPGCENGAPVCP